jgi:phenylacetate-coenzyme A ligase PaaK-like adenylate-forming protein
MYDALTPYTSRLEGTLARLSALPETARDLAGYATLGAQFGLALPPYLRTPLTLDAARRQVGVQLVQRERRFLAMVDRMIYRQPRSPYLRLLGHAGCERGDVQKLVLQEGLGGALRRLADAGVYVTFDEFKGRRPAVRGSTTFAFTDREFDNPIASSHFIELTGGTRGRPTVVRRPLGAVTDHAASFALAIAAHGIQRPRNLFWLGASPTWAMVHLKLGHTVDAWFYPITPLPPIAWAFTRYLRLLAHLGGRHLPALEHCDLTAPETIVRWLTSQPRTGQPIIVNTATSSAVRVAGAARAMGRSLEGVTFQCRMEPLTEARRAALEQSGARVLADYAAVELTSIAYGCPTTDAADDLHLTSNRYVTIERERAVFEGGPVVDALLFTTLSPFAPKVAFNTETGDTARIRERDCGCPLGSLGLRTHLSEIRSFEKLSSEGTSFARSNVIQILEQMLPARFGGTPLDYQLVEEEAPDGASRLILRVDPSIGDIDEAALLETMLRELRQGGMANAYQARLVQAAGTIVIRRLPPLATRAGKVLPFHLARTTLANEPVSR